MKPKIKRAGKPPKSLDKQGTTENIISENEPSSKNINNGLSDGEADKGKEISV